MNHFRLLIIPCRITNTISQSTIAAPLALENQFCFVLHSTSLAMTKTCKPFLDKLGLIDSQYLAMFISNTSAHLPLTSHNL